MVEITEYIQFMGFNSKSKNMYLVSREAPTPQEKSITKSLPYQQGSLDFSMLLGERVFDMREIRYEFIIFDSVYSDRKIAERKIKQDLMIHGRQKLYDTHDASYYWLAKCKSVEVENDHRFNRLKAIITFECYPYMFRHGDYFDDFFDSFILDDDVACYTKYAVNGSLEFVLFNNGTVSVKPEIITNANFKVTINDDTANITSGNPDNYYLGLKPGENKVRVEGTGTIAFHYRIEVMG